MMLARLRELSTRERQLLGQARQLRRSRARPAMNPAEMYLVRWGGGRWDQKAFRTLAAARSFKKRHKLTAELLAVPRGGSQRPETWTRTIPKKDLLEDAPLLYFPEGKTPPLLATTTRDARKMAAAGRRLELLKEGKEFDEERLVKSPLFGGRGGRQKLLGENPAPTARMVADARLMEMRDIFRSGITETTGRLIYRGGDQAGSRDVVGRLGGVKDSFPELAHEKAGPQAIAKAIERGRGVVYDRVRDAAERLAIKEGYRVSRPRKRGKLSEAAHKALRRYCRHCKTQHTKDEHRFHGAGAFHRTHMFAFNPRRRQRVGRIIEIRYEREIGNQPGFYKHVFRVPASLYRMPDNSILIR